MVIFALSIQSVIVVVVEVGNLHLSKFSKSGKRHAKLVLLRSLRREKASNPKRQ